MNRATLKELLQEIIAEEEGTSRLVAPVDPAAPTEKQASCIHDFDRCPVWAPVCKNTWCVAEERAEEPGTSELVAPVDHAAPALKGKYLSKIRHKERRWSLYCLD